MKRHLFTIMKKEFARFFGDKRMLATSLMPGIMIFIMYSFMGSGFSEIYTIEDTYIYQVQMVHMPQTFAMLEKIENFSIEHIEVAEMEDAKREIEAEKTDILVVFPENFEKAIQIYEVTMATEPAPNVEIYYNSARVESQEAYQNMYGILDGIEESMTNKFDIGAGEKKYDLGTKEAVSAMFISNLLPMLIMTFLFSGCLAVAAESIAGEKERGTIATLLVTPMRRKDLALGKLISLSLFGLLSGCSSFAGTMLSLPKLMQGSGIEEVTVTYSLVDYIVLLIVLLSVTLVIVGGISILSAFAKSVKEATSMTTPLMVVVMVISLSTMFGDGMPQEWYLYLIPIYNSVQCMNGVFSMNYQMLPMVLTVISNVLYTGLFVIILAKMFNSERIMYT